MNKGDRGDDGDKGDVGMKGDGGEAGQKGDTGDVGYKGEKGLPGPPGPRVSTKSIFSGFFFKKRIRLYKILFSFLMITLSHFIVISGFRFSVEFSIKLLLYFVLFSKFCEKYGVIF